MSSGNRKRQAGMGEAGHEPPEDEPAESQPVAGDSDGDARSGRPNPAQRRYLARGLKQAGGKLPLFDEYGQHVHPALVRACIAHGWAEPWFGNPLKADWLVCRLTDKGRAILAANADPH